MKLPLTIFALLAFFCGHISAAKSPAMPLLFGCGMDHPINAFVGAFLHGSDAGRPSTVLLPPLTPG